MTRLGAILGSLVILAACSMLPACIEDECDQNSFSSTCSGDTYEVCVEQGELWARSTVVESVNCAEQGATCVDGPERPECVDKPLVSCTAGPQSCSADGSAVKWCGASGYLTTIQRCDATERCIERAGQAPSCEVLAGVSCSFSGQQCAADSSAALFCHEGQAYVDRSCTPEEVCVQAGDEAGCVARALLPCDSTSPREICGDDHHAMLSCAEHLGYYHRTATCGAPNECVERLDGSGTMCLTPSPLPCLSSGFTCSADGTQQLYCRDGNGFVLFQCPAGQSCQVAGDGSLSCDL